MRPGFGFTFKYDKRFQRQVLKRKYYNYMYLYLKHFFFVIHSYLFTPDFHIPKKTHMITEW